MHNPASQDSEQQFTKLEITNGLIKIGKHVPPHSKSENYTWKGRPELRPQPASLPRLHIWSVWPVVSNPMDCSLPGSSVHGFSRQEYWSRVPLPSLNMLSRLVIIFLPRSKRLLISWMHSPFAVIWEPPKKSLTLFPLFTYLIPMK